MSERDSISAPEEKPEVWRAIPEFDGRYEASSCGRIRRKETERIVKHSSDRDGYMVVSLRIGHARTVQRRVGRMVLFAFAGNPPSDDCQCNHLDGNKANDALDNLEWSTGTQNTRHAIRLGLKQGRPRLTKAEVAEIVVLRGIAPADSVAQLYGVGRKAIQAIWKAASRIAPKGVGV